jgi:hypothetical protein
MINHSILVEADGGGLVCGLCGRDSPRLVKPVNKANHPKHPEAQSNACGGAV